MAGLAMPAPSPRLGASGAEVVTALAGHGPAVAVQFALTEGLPAIGIAVISVALARFAGSRGGLAAGRFALASGLVAAAISAVQAILGMVLAATTAPGAAYLLYAGVDRLDGLKMLALAVLGAAAAAMTALPRWLRWTAAVMAVAITGSGLVYLLLAASLAAAAGPALVLLLAFMTGCGIMIGMRTDPRDRRDMPRAGLTPERIIREAAAVADETGLDRLTLAAVAQRCGVSLPGLYKHVSGLEEVRRGIALLAVRELADAGARAAAGVSGTDALRAISAAYRGYALAHPGRYAASVLAPAAGDEAHIEVATQAFGMISAALAGYRLEDAALIHAVRMWRAACHGMATLQTAGGFGLPESVDVTFGYLVDALDTEFRRLGTIGWRGEQEDQAAP